MFIYYFSLEEAFLATFLTAFLATFLAGAAFFAGAAAGWAALSRKALFLIITVLLDMYRIS